MIWLTLRQARRELLLLTGLLLAVLVFFGVTGLQVRAEAAHLVNFSCPATYQGTVEQCRAIELQNHWAALLGLTPWVNTLPLLFGFLIGVPLIAQEVEQGTLRLSWTQSVTRRRWVNSKVGVFLTLSLNMAALCQGLMQWWDAPFTSGYSALTQPLYDFGGVLPYALAVSGFALGTCMGALTKRSVIAAGLTLVGYIALWLGSDTWLRFRLVPIQVAYAAQADTLSYQHNYALDSGWVDAHHHLISYQDIFVVCRNAPDYTACAQSHGWSFFVSYIPDTFFWPMQVTQSVVVFGVALLCLWLSLRVIRQLKV